MKGFHFIDGTFDPTMARSVQYCYPKKSAIFRGPHVELAYAQTAKKCPLGHSARQVGCPKISVKLVQALHVSFSLLDIFDWYNLTLSSIKD